MVYVFSQKFRNDIAFVLKSLHFLVEKENGMGATLADLDAEMLKTDQIQNTLGAQITANDAILSNLINLVKAGAPATDVTAELAKLQTQNATLAAALSNVAAADTIASAAIPTTPVATTPVTTPDPTPVATEPAPTSETTTPTTTETTSPASS
jgi:hypothetical protein